jgi:dATP pyrophosphohydrolase
LLLPGPIEARLSPREHLSQAWLPWHQAADRCFSWSNAEAIRLLPRRTAGTLPAAR